MIDVSTRKIKVPSLCLSDAFSEKGKHHVILAVFEAEILYEDGPKHFGVTLPTIMDQESRVVSNVLRACVAIVSKIKKCLLAQFEASKPAR